MTINCSENDVRIYEFYNEKKNMFDDDGFYKYSDLEIAEMLGITVREMRRACLRYYDALNDFTKTVAIRLKNEGLKCSEIADRLDISESSVRYLVRGE